MGRQPFKNTKEESKCISTQWLKENDYFCGYRNGAISWTDSWGNSSSIGIKVDLMVEPSSINFSYTTRNDYSDTKEDFDYSFKLLKIPCNLGGFRWAFECGIWKNNRSCFRKVYKLYKPPGHKYFGCRFCNQIVYESQRESGQRFEHLSRIFKLEKEYKKVYESIHKTHYQGLPTRKVKKLKKIENQIPDELSIAMMEVDLLK